VRTSLGDIASTSKWIVTGTNGESRWFPRQLKQTEQKAASAKQ
jgi:hypothetical protein